jgi:hypothetical protein
MCTVGGGAESWRWGAMSNGRRSEGGGRGLRGGSESGGAGGGGRRASCRGRRAKERVERVASER